VRTPQPASAKVLEKVLSRDQGDLTVADAAAKAGLPLRDAEEGLRYLAAEFSGHLAATEKGEILYSFPRGLERPPETRLLRRIGRGLVKAVVGVGRFIVRAWVSIVMVGYALAFLALMIALAARSDRDEGPGEAIGIVLRVIAEALFWTFHPFSPVYLSREPGWLHTGYGSRRARQKRIPFYEKVNRFVFGPPKPARDPLEEERKVLAELRRQKGRVAPADVMRVTGLDREEAERLLLRLLVDYQGELEVSDSGAIVYRFTDLRQTARADKGQGMPPPSPIWNQRAELQPLTGNTGGSNFLFVLINAFNLLGSGYVIAKGYTIERLTALLSQWGERYPLPLPEADGVPLVLGAVPFAFSAALFLFPLLRGLRRSSERAKVARENGWRGTLRLVLTGRRGRVELTGAELSRAWQSAAGKPPSERELRDAVHAMGGSVDLNQAGELVYKFDVVESELQATESERRAASAEEASPGEVVFSSADEGAGIREDQAENPAPTDPTSLSPVRRGEGRGEGRNAPPRALPEVPEPFPDPTPRRGETQEELLSRLGVDTRRRGR
jgi:hypothetical protein